MADLFPKWAWGRDFPDEAVSLSIIAGIFGFVNMVASIMLLNWKMSGFVILFISCLWSTSISVYFYEMPWGTIISLIVWFWILQIKKNGKSCWEQLS